MGKIANRHEGLRPVVIRFADEIAESLLTHDVEDRHVHLDFRVRPVGDREFDLVHPRSDGMQVCILILIEDEPPDERGLADSALAHEDELRLHPSNIGHRNPGRLLHSSLDYKPFRRCIPTNVRNRGRRRFDEHRRNAVVPIRSDGGCVLSPGNWNQHERRCFYPPREERISHAISSRGASNSRPQLAHRVVEIPRLVPEPRP